jgi:prepilin-type N-terminal cleavage/methylation domain-containing protein
VAGKGRSTVKLRRVKALTLMELLIVVVIVGILATMGIVSYRRTVVRAHEREAQGNLRLIQQAEEVHFLENNTFADCASPPEGGGNDCNNVLHLHLRTVNWSYRVAVNGTDFVVTATPGAGIAEADSYFINRGDADPTPCSGECPG